MTGYPHDTHDGQRLIDAVHHLGCMVDGCGDMPVLMWVDTFAPWQVILCAAHATDLPRDDEWIIGNFVVFEDCPSGLRRVLQDRAAELEELAAASH